MNNEQARVKQLEESAEFDQALIAKLNIDAGQLIGKDKLIAELQSQISDYIELTRALEAGQAALVRKFGLLNDENTELKEALDIAASELLVGEK